MNYYCPRTLEVGVMAADFIDLFGWYPLLLKPGLPQSRGDR